MIIARLVSAVRNNDFMSAGFWMLLATMLTGILGYVFQMAVARFLTVAEFGFFGAYLAIIAFLNVPKEVLANSVARLTAQKFVKNDLDSLSKSFFYLMVLVSLVCIAMSVLMLTIGRSMIPNEINYGWLLRANLIILVCSTFLVTLSQAILQGLKEFGTICFLLCVGVSTKLTVVLFLLANGYGVNGALCGVTVSVLVCLTLSLCFIYKHLRITLTFTKIKIKEKSEVLWILLSNLTFCVATQFDVLLVRYQYGAELAGQFFASSVIAKTVLFLPGAIILVVLPMSTHFSENQKSGLGMLYQSLAFTVFSSAFVCAVFFLFSQSIMVFIFGERYSLASQFLGIHGMVLIPITLCLVIEKFFLGTGQSILWQPFLMVIFVVFTSTTVWSLSLPSLMLIYAGSGSLALLFAVYKVHAYASKFEREL